MSKKRRVLRNGVLLLALIMALAVVFVMPGERFSSRADAHLEATIKHSVELYSDLGLEYHVNLNSNVSFSNIYLHLERQKFSGSGSAYTWESVDLKDYTVQNGEYVFHYYGLNAAEMPNLVRATVYAQNGNVTYFSDTEETSIRDYCQNLLNTYSRGSTQKEKALCTLLVDMLNYGAASQNYFKCNVNDLANAKLDSYQKGLASTLPTTFNSVYSMTRLYGSTCSIDHFEMENKPTTYLAAFLKFTSNPDSNTSVELSYTSITGVKKTVKKSFSDFTYDTSTKLYKVSFPEIKAPESSTKLTIVVKKGNNAISGTYTYSVESYMRALLDAAIAAGSNDEVGWAFMQNFMAYSTSAKKYFGVSGMLNTPTPTKKATNTPTTKPSSKPSPTTKPTNTPTKKPTSKPSPTKKVTNTPVPTAVHQDGYVTYREMGAKGDGVTDDYDAIVATHEYANKNNLRVRADKGAVYYIGHMDPNNKKGAVIMTDTDWTGATFKIDDKKIPWYYEDVQVKQNDGSIKIEKVVRTDEGDCYLFTVSSRTPMSHVYLNPANGTLGLDARFSSSTDAAAAKNFQNKTFSKNTTLLDGQFQETALYVLRTSSKFRWARNGSATASAEARDQMEVVIVDKYDANDAKNHPNKSRIDECTPLQWDWQEIHTIDKWPVDETRLTITGGTFYTNVNNLNSRTYLHRGINIQRSNVLMKGVKHYLEGERGADGQVNESCKYTYAKPTQHPVTFEKVYEVYYPRWGAPYQGFFRLDHCAHVTLSECVFSNHLRVYNNGDQTNSTAPYDYYAEYCADLVIDACTCAADEDDETGPADPSGIMDKSRWGTTGTNFCKKITVQNHSSISRIDAHKGTYDLTVVDSTIGAWGIAAVGFGDLYVANSTIRSREYLVKLRTDFGSAWFGDITINNCKWDIGAYYSASLIFAQYQPTYDYTYDLIYEDGWEYHSMLPENITINGLTIDATGDVKGILMRDGLPVYSTVLPLVKVPNFDPDNPKYIQVDDNYFNDPKYYKYPLRCTKNFTLSGLTYIKAKTANYDTIKVIPQRPSNNNHSEYYFKKFSPNMVHYNETPTVIEES